MTPAERAADAAATRERLRQTSPTISEAFPGVRSIAFKVHFTDFDGTPLKTEWIFTRTDRDNAFFQRACIASSPVTWADPRRCEGGGFDFRHAVERAVRDKVQVLSGIEHCQGRRGRWACRIGAHYEISVVSGEEPRAREDST